QAAAQDLPTAFAEGAVEIHAALAHGRLPLHAPRSASEDSKRCTEVRGGRASEWFVSAPSSAAPAARPARRAAATAPHGAIRRRDRCPAGARGWCGSPGGA